MDNQILDDTGPLVALARFEDVVALADHHRDIQMKLALERDVRLVHFEQGRIEFSVMPGGLPQLAQTLARRLQEWTGNRWMVAVSATPEQLGAVLVDASKPIYPDDEDVPFSMTSLINDHPSVFDPVDFAISRQELIAVYEFWWVKHLNDQLFHVISGCGINSNDYRRHMVALTRMDQIRNCLGEDVAKEAVKEFMERFWAKEDPELRIAYESGDYEAYWAKHPVECGYSVAPCKT